MWYRTLGFSLYGTLASILLVCGISCSKVPPTSSSQGQAQTDDGKPQPEDKPEKRKSLYITGIEFPSGHNWKPEIGAGSIEAKIFLMKDGERILEIPTGIIHETGIDSDMHKCFDGKLYTIYNNGHESIIKCNGEETVRFQDSELVYDFFAEEGKVHTLSKKGDGFIYRVNGNVVFECKNGSTYPGIYKDGKMTVFTYKEHKDAGYAYNYGYIGDGSAYTIDVNTYRSIEALRIHKRIVHYLGVDQFTSLRWYEYNGGQRIKIGSNDNGYMANTQMSIDEDGNVFILGNCYYETGTFPGIWNKDGVVTREDYDSKIPVACASNNQIYYVVIPKETREKIAVKRGRYAIHELPNQYDIMFPDNIGVYEDICCIAMHNNKDNKPVIWKNGITTEFEFNGYFTGVSYQ